METMEKKTKSFDFTLLITTILCILPVFLGLYVWDKLPEILPTTYGFNGKVTGQAPKWVTVFLMPGLLCLVNLFLHISFKFQKKEMPKNLIVFFKWFIPIIDIFVYTILILKPLNPEIDVAKAVIFVVSLIFIFIGNYLPKCPPNYMVGFRVPWTLKDETVWVKTHRFSGFFLVITGFISLVGTFTPFAEIIGAICILAILFVPLIYSLVIAKKSAKC